MSIRFSRYIYIYYIYIYTIYIYMHLYTICVIDPNPHCLFTPFVAMLQLVMAGSVLIGPVRSRGGDVAPASGRGFGNVGADCLGITT